MAWHLVVLVWLCITLAGCRFPTRTFMAEEPPKAKPAGTSAQARPSEIPVEFASAPSAPPKDAEESKPSAWSGWLGPFSPKKAEPKKPPQRIPLPRTDCQMEENPPGTAQVTNPGF